MSVPSTKPSPSTCTENNHRFIIETLRSITDVSEDESLDDQIQGRSLTDREIQIWLSQKLPLEEAIKTFNIYKGIEPKPLCWDRAAKVRAHIPSSLMLAPVGSAKKVRWQGDKPLQAKNKKFFLKSYHFIETFKGKVVVKFSNEWITKNKFCDQPWVEEHRKKYQQDDGDLFIYRPYKTEKPKTRITSTGKSIQHGYCVHLIAYQKSGLEQPSVEIKNSPIRTKGFLQYLTELIRYLFHKVIVFRNKIARKIFTFKHHLPERSKIEEHKKKWMQKDGELLISRPDKPFKYSVHLLDPTTTKRITFTRQSDEEQEGFLAI